MLRLVKRDTETLSSLGAADEADLIERCRADQRSAHDELYHRFRRQVAGNLYRVLGDRVDLEDLVQEVFVIAFRGLDKFRGDARLSTWLYRICVNVALGRIRMRRRDLQKYKAICPSTFPYVRAAGAAKPARTPNGRSRS